MGQYIYILLGKKILSVDWFQVQIGAAFLHVLAGELESRVGNLRACLWVLTESLT
jgi:hypothetical protein